MSFNRVNKHPAQHIKNNNNIDKEKSGSLDLYMDYSRIDITIFSESYERMLLL